MPLNRPLVALLAQSPDASRRVAFAAAAGGERSHADLVRDVFALSAELSATGTRFLVETEDAYRIGVALLAAAASRTTIVLPPNLQPGTLAELRASCDASIGDAAGPDAATRAAVDVDRDAPLVELYTSGTSGPGKRVVKSLRHLEDEVVELERGLGAGLARDAVVLATVSAHHLYGLLFRVLWPLAYGRALCRTSFLLPDELLARVGAHPRAILVSSPAHLRHLAASPRLAEHAPRIAAVFSSGGPLETRSALDIEAALGDGPIEIFGSTETGGIASRRVSHADPSPVWELFAPVRIAVDAEDDRLVVTSPFVTAPEHSAALVSSEGAQTWRMGDRVELAADGFRLLGRGDRVVKVGENTLSLPEIEERLASHELVAAALVAAYRERGVQRLGAIVVPNAAGKRRLAEDGRRALANALSAHLTERWDRVAIPRRWRFRDALPLDARGKFSQEAFETELSRPVEEPLEPLLTGERREGAGVVLEFVVPRDLAYLDGHYEAFPLVPGVVQIHWVMSALCRVLGREVSAQRMEAVKFKSVLRPAQAFSLRLDIDAATTRASFTLADGERVFSSGRVLLAAS